MSMSSRWVRPNSASSRTSPRYSSITKRPTGPASVSCKRIWRRRCAPSAKAARKLSTRARSPRRWYRASRAHGGLLTAQDFAAYTVTESAPISCRYRGYTIVSAPPPSSGGVVLCEMLQVLARLSAAGARLSLQRVGASDDRGHALRLPRSQHLPGRSRVRRQSDRPPVVDAPCRGDQGAHSAASRYAVLCARRRRRPTRSPPPRIIPSSMAAAMPWR